MTASRSSSRWATLVATTLAGFLAPFMDSATTVALPAIGRQFGMDSIALSWIRTGYLLAAAVFLVLFGKLADIHGRRRVFVSGTAVVSAAALLVPFAASGGMLIAIRTVQGLGAAMLFGTGVAILTSAFPPSQRGRVLGLNVFAVYLGLSVGPTIGGLLTGRFGWESIYFATAALGLVVLLLSLTCLHGEWADASGERLDLVGSGIYALALVALMLGLSRLPGLVGIALLAAAAVLLAVFAGWELRARNPVLDVALLAGNRAFAFSNLAALINYSATSAVAFLLSLYLQHIQALTPADAGWVLIAQPVVQAAFSPVAGWLSDWVEPRFIATAGMVLTACGLVALSHVSGSTPLWTIRGWLALMGLGFALFSSPNMSSIMGSVQARHYGVASGMLGTMRLVGQMLSMGVTTLLFVLFLGQVPIGPAVHPQFMRSMRTAFLVFAALCVLGTLASLARGRIREGHEAVGTGTAVATPPDR